jgi:protein gp37
MAENTHISWATDTFNPWIGCSRVSTACRFCYAEALDKRWGHHSWGATGARRVTSDANWRKPIKWNREVAETGWARRVFCASMADVFEDHPALLEPRSRLWALIEQTPNLNWLLLTKRPENAAEMTPPDWAGGWPPWVWLGVTAETQRYADERVPVLCGLPVTGERFVSVAPQLGPVDPTEVAPGLRYANRGFNALVGVPRVTWVITEGESGPRARPSHPAWFRSLRDQCVEAGVAFHHKQTGEWSGGPFPPYWHPADGLRNPKRHCYVNSATGKTRPFGEFTGMDDADWVHVARVGLRHAGRLLDGVLWDQVPGVEPAAGVEVAA